MSQSEVLKTVSAHESGWSWHTGEGWLKVVARESLVIAAYLPAERTGGVRVLQSDGLATSALNDLKSKFGARLVEVQFKLVGSKELMDRVVPLFQREHLGIVAAKAQDPSGFLLYFSPSDGRLRLEKQPADVPVSPVESPATVAALGAGEHRCKVLIVDDSKTIRQVLRAIFQRDPKLEVVGECENPLDVEAAIERLKPDVISCDINMPEMDGVTLVKKVLAKRRIPFVMVTALSMEQGDQVLQALNAGAVDYIQKPALGEIDQLAQGICERFRVAARARVQSVSLAMAAPIKSVAFSSSHVTGRAPLIAIGASTGGTEAIRHVLQSMPASIPPVVIVQHIPPVFSKAFAQRLASILPFEVREAADGDQVQEGRVLIAPGGFQMRLVSRSGQLRVEVRDGSLISGHKPSVDCLFDSVAEVVGKESIGVILTGMGRDGADGLLKMRKAGARTIGQDEATSVVYGMPGVAAKVGAVERELPLDGVAAQIVGWVERWGQKKVS